MQWVEEGEAGWRRWFGAHSIAPLEIAYEDMTRIRRLTTVVRDIAAFLRVRCHKALGRSILGCFAKPTITPNVW
jgi:LPS sulfotransferase NodH